MPLECFGSNTKMQYRIQKLKIEMSLFAIRWLGVVLIIIN